MLKSVVPYMLEMSGHPSKMADSVTFLALNIRLYYNTKFWLYDKIAFLP